jgi:hypothetical protein
MLSHTPAGSMHYKFSHDAKLRIPDATSFILGLGAKMCFILHYLWHSLIVTFSSVTNFTQTRGFRPVFTLLHR